MHSEIEIKFMYSFVNNILNSINVIIIKNVMSYNMLRILKYTIMIYIYINTFKYLVRFK